MSRSHDARESPHSADRTPPPPSLGVLKQTVGGRSYRGLTHPVPSHRPSLPRGRSEAAGICRPFRAVLRGRVMAANSPGSAPSASDATRVRVLPAAVAARIAAGEVVERPASVVKELVENALDAGARRVTVELEDGGIGLIRVADDGCGMVEADAELAFTRHATSKLRAIEDLDRLATLGFRGEALPSIAAVAAVELTTRVRDAVAAVHVRTADGRVAEVRAAGAPAGTTVTVRDLFAPVPARRKFLKSVATEVGHVADLMARQALARVEAACTSGGNLVPPTIEAVKAYATVGEIVQIWRRHFGEFHPSASF